MWPSTVTTSRIVSPIRAAGWGFTAATRKRVLIRDARISYSNSFLPGQRIAGFSHLSVHIAPANAHYGTHGDYRSCGQASGERAEVVARCLDATNPWRGEVFGDNRAGIPDGTPVARLTYNPRFDELLEQVDEFLSANSF